MIMRILSTGLCLFLAIGCAKKGTKDTAPARDDVAKAKTQQPPAANNDKKAEKEPEPNWIKGPLGGKKDQPDQLPVDGPTHGAKPPLSVGAPPPGGFTAPVPGVQPVQPPGGVVPGTGAPAPGVQPVRPPGVGVLQPSPVPNKPAPAPGTPALSTKRVEQADMKDVWVFIENASGASGKMPASATTFAALVKAESPAAELVKNGAIILTDAKQRESVWAFEANAYLNGGLVVSQNGVETLTAAELKQRLGK